MPSQLSPLCLHVLLSLTSLADHARRAFYTFPRHIKFSRVALAIYRGISRKRVTHRSRSVRHAFPGSNHEEEHLDLNKSSAICTQSSCPAKARPRPTGYSRQSFIGQARQIVRNLIAPARYWVCSFVLLTPTSITIKMIQGVSICKLHPFPYHVAIPPNLMSSDTCRQFAFHFCCYCYFQLLP